MQVKNVWGVPNQFIINEGNKEIFQSYSTMIGYIENGIYYITDDIDYSSTTSKYSKKFFGERVFDGVKKLKKKGLFIIGKQFEIDGHTINAI